MSEVDSFKLKNQVVDARYRVEDVIGEGSFGVIYRATQMNFDEPVAIKVLKIPALLSPADAADFLQSFRAEGKYLRKLSAEHPAFVRALDTGIIDVDGKPAPYLVLEWLDGIPLEKQLAERREKGESGRSLEESMAILEPIFGALTCAHAQRVAHRDIKPGNLFLTRTSMGMTLKLLDFGLAKVMTDNGTLGLQAPTQGALPGLTPAYAAPEQWDRQLGSTGPWSDVFSLALVFVELLTDKPALDGDDVPSYMAAVFDQDVRPTPKTRGAMVAPEVEAVFAKALAVYPKDRYREAGAFWNALVEASEKIGNGSTKKTFAKVVAPIVDMVALDATVPALESSSETEKNTSNSMALADTALPNAPAVQVVDAAEKGSDNSKTETKPPASGEDRKRAAWPLTALLMAAMLVIGLAGGKMLSGRSADTNVAAVSAAPSTNGVETSAPKKKRVKWWEDLPDAPDKGTKGESASSLNAAQQKWLALRDQALQQEAESLGSPKKRDDAAATLRAAQKLACNELGHEDPACAESMRLLGVLLAQMGRLAEAEQLLREALDLNEKYGDKDDEDFDDSRKALAAVLVKQGKRQEAQSLLKPGEMSPGPAKPAAPAAAAPVAAQTSTGSKTQEKKDDDSWMKVLDQVQTFTGRKIKKKR